VPTKQIWLNISDKTLHPELIYILPTPNNCIKSPPPDLDCGDTKARNFKVLSPHGFEGDNDAKLLSILANVDLLSQARKIMYVKNWPVPDEIFIKFYVNTFAFRIIYGSVTKQIRCIITTDWRDLRVRPSLFF
jgi:hypothetical protein